MAHVWFQCYEKAYFDKCPKLLVLFVSYTGCVNLFMEYVVSHIPSLQYYQVLLVYQFRIKWLMKKIATGGRKGHEVPQKRQLWLFMGCDLRQFFCGCIIPVSQSGVY